MTDGAENARLSTEQFAKAHEAILSAYGLDELDIRIRLKWGLRLGDWVVLAGVPYRGQVKNLLEWTEAEGRTRELLGLLWTERPGNVALNAVARALVPDLAAMTTKYTDHPPAPPGAHVASRGALEAEVSARSRLMVVGLFESALETARGAVCRIEAGGMTGTGFLIGESTVLTNYHVVEKARLAQVSGDAVICRFDVLQDGDEGVPVPGLTQGWLGPFSPFSASDVSGDGAPKDGEFDFAVIHLAAPVDPARAPLRLSALPPVVAPLDVAIILQHPRGDAMRVALGSVLAFPADGLRYRYNVTTQPGSSGAPVFSATLSLIGLHHAADPGRNPTYNQAVPIWRIARDMAAQGLDPAGL